MYVSYACIIIEADINTSISKQMFRQNSNHFLSTRIVDGQQTCSELPLFRRLQITTTASLCLLLSLWLISCIKGGISWASSTIGFDPAGNFQ